MDAHINADLLAYLDGELSARERARVEAHLAECSQCQAELEQLRVLRRELDVTFDAALQPLRLPADADQRIRSRLLPTARPHTGQALWRRRGLIAQALLAILVAVFALNLNQALSVPPPAGPQETLVFGQNRLAPNSKASLRVIVRSAEEATPVEGAEVVVRIGRTPGLARLIFSGQTGADGTANVNFTVPDDIQGEANLVVETRSAGGEDQIVRPITIARSYKLFLYSDKPAYRPGQDVHLRVIALDAVSLQPVAGGDVLLAVFDAAEKQVEERAVAISDFGVAALDVPLPPDAPHGQYTLRAAMGDTASERTVTVGAYELPAFRVDVETGRTFYAPGDHVAGTVQADYFFGRPVPGGRVTMRGYIGEAGQVQAIQVVGETDDRGRFEFAFDLPATPGAAYGADGVVQLALEVEVVDAAGQRERTSHLLPVAEQPIIIDAIPEDGVIRPGIENLIFILTAYPDGQPAETTLTIELAGERRALRTGPYGLAEYRLTPSALTHLEVEARDAQGAVGQATFDFEGELAPAALLLRAEQAIYEVGDTLRLEALTVGLAAATPQVIYLDVIHNRQTVAVLSAPLQDGRATFALDLDGTMIGTLQLHAYHVLPDGDAISDTRLVVVDAPRRVTVALAVDQETYRPGDTAHLQIETTIASNEQASSQPGKQAVQSMLGIGVVDESVYALDTLPPSFARAFFLVERQMLRRQVQGVSSAALLASAAEERAAQDVAGRAAWAGAPAPAFTLSGKSVATVEQEFPAQATLASWLGLALVLIPTLSTIVVVRGLRPSGVLGPAFRRLVIGLLLAILTSPVVLPVVGGGMWVLWTAMGVGAPILVSGAILVLLAAMAVHGWLHRDIRVQLAAGMVGTYLALGAMLVVLAAQGGDLVAFQLVLIAGALLLIVGMLALLGQGLVVEGSRLAGWTSTLVGLLLIPLVVYLPFVPGLSSDLTRTLGHPALYAGPVAWVTGCAPAATVEPVEVEAEKEVEAELEATAAPVEAPAEETAGTLTPPATPTPAPSPLPPTAEPFPLRQVFPETLYWDAEAITDKDGHLTLELPLADNITTWRLTALASTREGDLGVAAHDIVVFREFFLDLDLPLAIRRGEIATATVRLFNYLPEAQTVRLEPVPADWYSPSLAPQTLSIPADGVAQAEFLIRPERAGNFTLQVVAEGAHVTDAIAREVTVAP